MMGINPIWVNGLWDEGWVLDTHIIKSVPIGENAYGYMQFDNTYSEMGELLYYFKNRGRYENLDGIMDLVIPFLDEWEAFESVDMILPAPPTKTRNYQPAIEIALAIAEYYKIGFSDEVLEKTSAVQAKGMGKVEKDLTGSIVAKLKAKKNHTILLVDDLFSTGATLNECVRILKQDSKLQQIYVLAMTKTK